MPEGLAPQAIDDFVAAAMAAGEDLYRLDAGALAELDADLVVTQDLCAVCAVDVDTVDEALGHLGCRAEVATLDPHSLDEVLVSITEVGRLTGNDEQAAAVVAGLEERLAAVADRVAGLERPRVLVLEWTDPPFAPGHWIPEMVTRAGGEPALGVAGTRSGRITWEEAIGSRPDVVVCAPCGFDLEGCTTLAEGVRDRFPGVPVWAVDADGHFARPGPRLVDGVEVLAGILHPDAVTPSAHCRQV
jgi:iron complex transport system substrate-binding protein